MSITDIVPQGTALIGQRLREARTAMGLTQEQVAEHLGVRQGRVSMLERGSGTNPITLLRLAHLYGTTTDYLIGGDGVEQSAA